MLRNLTSNQGLPFSAPTKPPYFVNYRFGDVTSIANIAGQMFTSRKRLLAKAFGVRDAKAAG
ncbi:MAG: hypothetical protein DMF10_04465 [Verrucomicrobia bacterium]|nr:MAG: hypothetical protein DMF11_04695 [Verrucomicrobiota bacterium]PYI48321.1 MAG: hypothetical protein DMF10_04465 [Verrucomicrobiota bacterium]